MRDRGQALYLTLVDFLIQLIFLALLLGVLVTLAIQSEKTDIANRVAHSEQIAKENAALRDTVEKLKKASGISNLTVLTDFLSKLGPISDAAKHAATGRALEHTVASVGGVDNAKRLLEEQIRRGQGKPSCLPDQRRLVTFHAFEDRIEVRGEPSADFVGLLSRLQVPMERTRSMSFSAFAGIFRTVPKIEPDCRYNVTVLEYSPFKRPRDVIREAFIAIPQEAR